MAGTYATDLTTLYADGPTPEVAGNGSDIIEFTNFTSGGGNTRKDGDTDIFIQGINGLSTNTSNSPGQVSIGRLLAAAITNTTGHVLSFWSLTVPPSALNDFAAGGEEIIIGSANNTYRGYLRNGSDTYRFGGWRHNLLDWTNTATGTVNNAYTNNTNIDIVGIGWDIVADLRRPALCGIDAIRVGRHTLTCTGGTQETTSANIGTQAAASGNFVQMAAYNDYNDGVSAPNGTDVDGAYHVFGQLTDVGGSYLAKGIVQIGSTTTSTYFEDVNKIISVPDEFLTYDDFTRFEIRQNATTVVWDTITINFISRPSVVSAANAPATTRGNLEVFNNPTITMKGCSFNGMGTFIYQSNSDLDDTTFRQCGQVTQNSGSFTNCSFENCREDISLLVDATTFEADIEKITNTSFTSDGSNHAIALDAAVSPSTDVAISLDNIKFTDYSASSALDTNITGTAADANAAISLIHNGTGTIFFDVLNGGDVPSVENTGTGNVQVRQTFSLDVTGLLGNTEVRVYDNPSLFTGGGSSTEIAGVETVAATTVTGDGAGGTTIHYTDPGNVRINGTGTDFTTLGLSNGDTFRIVVRDQDQNPNLSLFDEFTVSGTPTATVIDTTTADIPTTFTNLNSSTNSLTVTVEKVNATQTFSVGSGTYDIFVYRIGSLPIITKAFEVTVNSRIPISQAVDRVYKNPA